MMYFIAGIVSGLLCFKCYLVGYGKGIKNPFANLFFWSALFVSLAFLKSAAGIPIYISLNNNELLFWNDFIGRMLFYTAAVFSVRIPLYRLYPKSKKTIIFSYLYAGIGVALLVYQFFNRNIPIPNSSGIINWEADVVLAAGMAVLLILPWAVISYIFIREFIRSKFTLPKPFLLGSGYFLICVAAIFQDLSTTVTTYVFFGMLLIVGFLSLLAGLFFEKD